MRPPCSHDFAPSPDGIAPEAVPAPVPVREFTSVLIIRKMRNVLWEKLVDTPGEAGYIFLVRLGLDEEQIPALIKKT